MEDSCQHNNRQSTVVVKKNEFEHDCSSNRRKKKIKNATKHWVCRKVKDFLIQDATLGARELQKKIKEHHKVHIHYKRVYYRQKLALKELYGDWDSSFNNLFRFKAQVESSCPGHKSGSNQPGGLSVGEIEGAKKGKGKRKKIISKKTPEMKLLLDSPAMGTRSKMVQPASPAMSTRSKRRLSL